MVLHLYSEALSSTATAQDLRKVLHHVLTCTPKASKKTEAVEHGSVEERVDGGRATKGFGRGCDCDP